MSTTGDVPPVTEPRYVRVVVAWAVAVVAPVVAGFLLLAWAVESRCGPDSVDCSWGFEFLLLIPVLVVCVLVVAPLAVFISLHLVRDPLAGRTVGWTYLALVPALLLSAVTGGAAVVVGAPLAGRYMARRRAAALAGAGVAPRVG